MAITYKLLVARIEPQADGSNVLYGQVQITDDSDGYIYHRDISKAIPVGSAADQQCAALLTTMRNALTTKFGVTVT